MPVDNQASSTRPIDIKHALFAIGPTATKYVINYLTLTNTHGRRQVDSINAWLNPATCKNKNNNGHDKQSDPVARRPTKCDTHGRRQVDGISKTWHTNSATREAWPSLYIVTQPRSVPQSRYLEMVEARLIASGMVERTWLHGTNDDNRVVCLAKYVTTHGCRQVDGMIRWHFTDSLERNADPYKCDPAARSPTPYPTLTMNYLAPVRGTM